MLTSYLQTMTRRKRTLDQVRLHIRVHTLAENMVKQNIVNHSLRIQWMTSLEPESECIDADKSIELQPGIPTNTAVCHQSHFPMISGTISSDEIFDQFPATALALRCTDCIAFITANHQSIQSFVHFASSLHSNAILSVLSHRTRSGASMAISIQSGCLWFCSGIRRFPLFLFCDSNRQFLHVMIVYTDLLKGIRRQ